MSRPVNVVPLVVLTAVALSTSGVCPRSVVPAAQPAEGAKPAEPSFSVVTRVFGDDAAEPLAVHRILVEGGRMYDLPASPPPLRSVVTVFDPSAGRVVLLDRAGRTRAEVATNELLKLAAELRLSAEKNNRERQVGLLATVRSGPRNEKHRIEFDSGRFGNVRYETTVQKPADPRVAQQFGQFCDWAARLNLARRTRTPPPFARMRLNRTLAVRGQLPKTITVTLGARPSGDRFRVEHELTTPLAPADRAEVRRADGEIVEYRLVGFDELPQP